MVFLVVSRKFSVRSGSRCAWFQYSAAIVRSLQTLRYDISGPINWTYCILKKEQTCCLETSVRKYQSMLQNIPEES